MRYKISTLAALVLFPSLAFSQTSGETDMSNFMVVPEEQEPLTLGEFENQKNAARKLYLEDKCAEAIPALIEVQDNANRLANIISQGLKPFYTAPSEDTEWLSNTQITKLASAEDKANELKGVRNEYYVLEAECLLKIGQKAQAINKLFRVLDFINGGTEYKLWYRSRILLWETIGFEID